MEKATTYSLGTFGETEFPLNDFTSGTHEEWLKNIFSQGYCCIFKLGCCEDEPAVMFFGKTYVSEPCEWPYFCIFDSFNEGRYVFMKNWYDVSHFINNHASCEAFRLIESTYRGVHEILYDKLKG